MQSAPSSPSAHRVEVRLLGPTEALVDGRSVPLGGPRPRALLTALALSAGTAIPSERLVEDLWHGAAPAGGANTVQVYASRLRRALQPPDAPPVLRSALGGYLLDVPAEAVDVTRLEQLATSGHNQLVRGDASAAARTLATAVGLWRGPALLDLETPTAAGLRARLEHTLLTARAERADAQMALGHAEGAVGDLEELVRLHPLDEGLVARLMTALYLTGRQADALATYRAAGQRLVDELGVDPGDLLRLTHDRVLRQEVEPPGRVVGPTPVAPTGLLPAPASEPLRRPRTPMVGRRAELQLALDLLSDPGVRVVTLVGPGGIGKTRLALAVADAMASAGPSEQRLDLRSVLPRQTVLPTVVVPLASASDEGELLASVCQAVGAEPAWAGQDPLDLLAEALAGQRLLLVLDNLEQLMVSAGPADCLVDLLDRLPGLSLLCTSRVALRIRDERQVPLGPLALPDVAETDPEVVLTSEAVQLFLERATAVAPDFDVTADNAQAVAELCRLLDGQPLALELAAARTRMLPPQDLVRRTGRLLQVLTGGSRDLPQRQRSMRAALDGSAQLLDQTEADVFAQLSVFVDGWTVDAAEQVVAGAGDDLVDVLGRLVDKSLVVADGSGRLSMLEIVREYAGERLAQRDQELGSEVSRRHASYFAGLATRLGALAGASPDASTRTRLDHETGNLGAALDYAASQAQVVDGRLLGELVIGLVDYWFYSGRVGQAERWLAVAEAAVLPTELRATLLRIVGNLALVKGDLPHAVAALDEALELGPEVGDPWLTVRVLKARSHASRHAGRLEDALGYIERAIAAVEQDQTGADFGPGRGPVLGVLNNERGEILAGLGADDEARVLFDAYRAQALADGDHSNLAWALVNVALSECDRGNGRAAVELAAAALVAADAGGSTPVQADARAAAGLVELTAGDPQRAVTLLVQATRLSHESGLLLTMPDTVSLLGAALLATGRPAEASRMLAAGAAWREARGLAVIGRLAAVTISTAERELAARLESLSDELARTVVAERVRGQRAAYGGLDPLDLPKVPAPAAERSIRLVDLRPRTPGVAASS